MALDAQTIGTVGGVLLVLGWLPQTWQTLREHRSRLHPAFSGLYLAGSVALAYYSWLIASDVFLVLNALAAFLALVSLYYSLGRRKGS